MPGLLYAGDTADPVRAKFYGDMQERITAASLHLLFFTLELNRLDDAVLEAAMADPALGHYRPWIEDIRKDKPYQLEDRVEQLFHEKSVTGYSAWNRLFDETMARPALQGRRQVAGDRADAQPDAGPDARTSARRRREALAKTFKENLRLFTLHHQHARQGQGDFRPLARLRRRRGRRAISSNRVEPEVVDALVSSVRAAYPRLSHRYYALKAQLVRQEAAAALGPQRAAAEGRDAHHRLDRGAATRCSPPMARSRRRWRRSRERFFNERWIDAPVRPGKSPGAFAHPTVPSAHPYVLLNYQGKPRDVMTLAHELGHGVHQVLAAPNGALMAPTPLTLAETASVFGEMLTFKKLLAETTDKKQRKAMLAAKVEDMINTVVRQIAFYTFERKVHTERRNGELTAEQHRRDLDGGAAREPRPGDRPRARLRDVLDLHPALHPFAVLRLRLCVRRLPGELALRGLRAARTQGFAERYLDDARGRRHQAPFRAARAVRPRRPRPGVLAGRAGRDRADDRGAGAAWISLRRELLFDRLQDHRDGDHAARTPA